MGGLEEIADGSYINRQQNCTLQIEPAIPSRANRHEDGMNAIGIALAAVTVRTDVLMYF